MSVRINKLIDQLSERQKAVVNWGEGPAVVLGGPGTGKTHVLACRAARLLADASQSDIKILGLTFTNKAAGEMTSRIKSYLPRSKSSCVIRTYHGMCADLLREFGDHVGISPTFTIYPDTKQLKQFVERISNFADSDNSHRSTHRESSSFSVEDVIKDENIIDFSSLIAKSTELLTNFPDIVNQCQSRYKYWIIDEFQDTTREQFYLLQCLAGESFRNIMFVGDDDQNIFEWNGSDIFHIRDFAQKLKATMFYLNTSYRTGNGESILRASRTLSSYNRRRLKIPERVVVEQKYQSVHDKYDNKQLRCVRLPDRDSEMSWIAHDIAMYDAKYHGSIAVLSRRKNALVSIQQELRNLDINAYIHERFDSFQTPELRWMLAVLQLALNPMSKFCLAVVIYEFHSMCAIRTNMQDVLALAAKNRNNYLAAWCILSKRQIESSWAQILVDITSHFIQPYSDDMKIVDELFKAIQSAKTMSVHVEDSEHLDRLKRDILAWGELSDRILRLSGADISLANFVHYIQVHSKKPRPHPNAVNLLTIHRSKGLEFNLVYLANMADGVLPDFRTKSQQALEQERRVCFVALTRASQSVIMTYSSIEGVWSQKLSPFVEQMRIAVEAPDHVLVPIVEESGDSLNTSNSSLKSQSLDIEDYDEELQVLIGELHSTGKFAIDPADDIVADGKVQGHYSARIRSGEKSLYLIDRRLEHSKQLCSILSQSGASSMLVDFEDPPLAELIVSKLR